MNNKFSTSTMKQSKTTHSCSSKWKAKSASPLSAPAKSKVEGCQADHFVDENSRPKDGKTRIREGIIRTKEKSGDTEEKVAICVINMGEKRPNPMISEEQVSQGVEISAKIVIPNVEND